MRIIFVCGGIEPGRDGVGDYIRRLSGELSHLGHTVGAVAINDTGIDTTSEEQQGMEAAPFVVLRLPRSLIQRERAAQAARWIGKFQPDWISLQFVCFGFHPKGFVSGWTTFFSELCSAYRVHWMFHELWVRSEKGLPWHYGPWGWLQRRQMLKLHRRLSPLATHTSNEFYAKRLKASAINAEILPLFGNIPISRDREWWPEIERVAAVLQSSRADRLVLGVFGTIHWSWLLENWFTRVLQWAQANGCTVAMLGIGRLSETSRKMWEKLKTQYSGQAGFHHFGEQSPARVSQYLSFLDYGVATGQASMAGKSGTIAAMLEHGKEVLVPCWDLPTDGSSPIAGVSTKRRFGMASLMIDSEMAKFGVENIANRLMNTLEAIKADLISPLANRV
jgi:hypothetical protein